MATEQDLIGPWSEVKLDILREYAGPYSQILSASGLYHIYIDAFAAGGSHISRRTGEEVAGSATIALQTNPPFREYHFIDRNPRRVERLKGLASGRSDVHVHQGDCNDILSRELFPKVQYAERRRALCVLDPYNIDLAWDVVAAAGQAKTIEIFLNFMVMDMNMNVLLRDSSKASPAQIKRMDRFWGDSSWRQVAYEISKQMPMFGEEEEQVKVEDANSRIAEAYRQRLVKVAGFAFVPAPLPFVNDIGRTIYYLLFASANQTGKKIVDHIFAKHRKSQGL